MIDPSIALQVRPPQIESPVESYARAMSLKQMARQGALGQEHLKATQLANREREQDMRDQQTMRAAYMESGGDMDKFKALVTQRGISPKAVMALDQAMLTHRQKLAQIKDDELKLTKARVDAVGSAAQSVLSAPPEQRPALFSTAGAELVKAGHLKPEELPKTYPGDDWLQYHANASRTSQQILEGEIKQREEKRAAEAATRAAAEHEAKLPGIQAEAALKIAEAKGEKPTQPHERVIEESQATQRTETERHNREMESLRAAWQKQGGMTPAQAATQQRADEREIESLNTDEDAQHRMRRRLFAAIQGVKKDEDGNIAGGIYITRSGEVKSLASLEDEDAKRAAVEDMKETFRAATDKAKRIIAEKNKIIERRGGQPVVSTERAHREIDAAGLPWESQAKTETAKKGQPPTVPAAKPADQGTKPAKTPAPPVAPAPKAPPRRMASGEKPAETAKPGEATKKKQWVVAGVTYTEGQEIKARGKRWRIKDVQNGKIQADPLD